MNKINKFDDFYLLLMKYLIGIEKILQMKDVLNKPTIGCHNYDFVVTYILLASIFKCRCFCFAVK